jgi:hypothetical protein
MYLKWARQLMTSPDKSYRNLWLFFCGLARMARRTTTYPQGRKLQSVALEMKVGPMAHSAMFAPKYAPGGWKVACGMAGIARMALEHDLQQPTGKLWQRSGSSCTEKDHTMRWSE